MAECALIPGAGALLASPLALGISAWQTSYYGELRLSLLCCFLSAAVLLIVGQLAARQPARRAARTV